MKKIVVNIISGFNDGGAQKVVYDIANKLKNDNMIDVKICVICKNENSNLSKLCNENNISIEYLNYESSKKRNFFAKVKDFFKRNMLVYKYLRRVKPDILHTHITPIFKMIPFSFLFCNIHCMIHTHHSDPYAIDKVSVFIARLLFKLKKIQSICVSEDQKLKVDKVYKINNSIVIHNGIDFNKHKPEIKEVIKRQLNIEEKCVIGFVGRLEKVKNIKFAIDIYDKFEKIVPDSVFYICGNGSLENELKEYALKKSCCKKINFLGNVKDLNRIYSIMDYFILTSFFESSSIATIEAQAYNIHCFISDAIPSYTIYSNYVKRMPLSIGVEAWVKGMIDNKEFDFPKSTKESYDIEKCIEKIKKVYLQMSDKNE